MDVAVAAATGEGEGKGGKERRGSYEKETVIFLRGDAGTASAAFRR